MEYKLIKPYTKTLYYDNVVQSKTCRVRFGKNGRGLTEEFDEISALVKELSKEGLVYLTDSFTDELDDVYELTFKVFPDTSN